MAMPSRTWGNVIAGVAFFPPTRFRVDKPGGDEGECLMVMPARPAPHLVVRQARFGFAALDALLNPVFCRRHAPELRGR